MLLKSSKLLGHFIAFFTIFLWSLTFVQTKVLLKFLTPIEILLDRFSIAWLLFFIFTPKLIKTSLKDEFLFALLGISGIFGYYLFENLSLEYTKAINVGVIVTTAPVFTAFILMFFKPKTVIFTFISFSFVMIGLFFMGFNFKFNFGNFLALIGALCFGVYTVLLGLIDKKYNILIVTRKSFFYGVIFLLIYYLQSGTSFNLNSYKNIIVWGNLLTLSLIASGICFIMWNYAVKNIGSSSTSLYIYLVPVINAIAAVVVLNEKITVNLLISSFFIVIGLLIAQKFNKG